MSSILLRCGWLLFLGMVLTLDAQPPSAIFRPALVESLAAGYSFSGASDLSRDGPHGEVSVRHFEASASGRVPVGERTTLIYGVAIGINELDADAGLALPDRLGELSLNLGVQRRLSTRWSVSGFLRPGIYGDLENMDSDSFNAPVLVMASYAASRELVWLTGVAANPFSERIVMPVAGVRWVFAPSWTLNIGFPRVGVSWAVREGLSLHAGLGIQGGTYRITENLGVPAPGVARLANTYVQYREIRVGLGAEWALTKGFSLTAEAGAMLDRRFEYFDRNYTLNGEAAPYVTLKLDNRF